jgi:hypothetical protein
VNDLFITPSFHKYCYGILVFFPSPVGILNIKGPATALEAGAALEHIPIMCIPHGDFRKKQCLSEDLL